MTSRLFVRLDAAGLAQEISSAEHSVCYAAPGIFDEPARALARFAHQFGPELVSVCLDFDERVLRMGFGSLEAVKILRDAGIGIRSTRGLRSGILVVDDDGFIFTPTALYLESDKSEFEAPNAMRLSREQAQEALARLSPAAKMLAMALAHSAEEKQRIAEQAVEIDSTAIGDGLFGEIEDSLSLVPPVDFDVARQVRVYTAYLQYVDLKMIGAAIDRKRIRIPPSIQRLGGDKTIEGRLKTTFDLIERSGELSSKALEDELNAIRKDYTRSLGAERGRVMLKAVQPEFEQRIAKLQQMIDEHQRKLETKLQEGIDDSREQVIEHFVPLVVANPPDEMKGQFLRRGKEEARLWLGDKLQKVFPQASSLLQSIRLHKSYKDMTFETLNDGGFLDEVKKAYPHMPWDKAHEEFQAARAADTGATE